MPIAQPLRSAKHLRLGLLERVLVVRPSVTLCVRVSHSWPC